METQPAEEDPLRQAQERLAELERAMRDTRVAEASRRVGYTALDLYIERAKAEQQ